MSGGPVSATKRSLNINAGEYRAKLGPEDAPLLDKLKRGKPLTGADVWRLLRVAKRSARRD